MHSNKASELRESNAALEKRVADLTAQLQAEAKQAATRQRSHETLQQTSAQLKAQNADLIQRQEASEAAENSSTAIIASLRESMAAHESAARQQQQESSTAIVSLEAQVEQLRRDNSELTQQAEPLRQSTTDANALVASLRNEISTHDSILSQQQQAHQAAIASLQAEAERLRQENLAGQQTAGQDMEPNGSFQAELKHLRKENGDLLQSQAAAMKQGSSDEDHNAEVERLRATYELEQKQLQQQLQEQHQQQLEAIQAALQEEHAKQLSELSTAVATSKAETASAHNVVQELQAELRRWA